MAYDSTADTQAHIAKVRRYLAKCCANLTRRAVAHDESKLRAPEKSAYDAMTPRLAGLSYGSDEYRACLKEMKGALSHHYAANTHHPEHYANGIAGMSLFDVMEMVMDWKAASERHDDGDIWASVAHNRERFDIEPQLASIIRNTAKEMGW